MYRPTLSPVDPNLGMITCDMGGVYLTQDGGSTWTILPPESIGRYGHGIAFSPIDARTMFVGTSTGLFLSNDGAKTWRQVSEARKHPLCAVMDVAVDPTDPSQVWAAFGVGAEAGQALRPGNRLLIERSSDGGKTFTAASAGLPTQAGLVRRIALDSNSPTGRRTLYAATSLGLYVSKDGGGSWEKTGREVGQDLRNVVTLCDPTSKRTVVLVSGERSGIFRSDDGSRFAPVDGVAQSAIIEELAGSRRSATIAYAAGSEIWKTMDGGRTWAPIFDAATKHAGWLTTCFPWALRFCRGIGCDPVDPDRFWATGDMVLWSSADGGASLIEQNSHPVPKTARRLTYRDQAELGRHGLLTKPGPKQFSGGGLEVTFTYQVCLDPHDVDTVYGCYADIGGFRSKDRGISWMYNLGSWNQGIPSEWRNSCYDIACHPMKAGVIWGAFAGLHNLPGKLGGNRYEVGGIAGSTDGGATWTIFEKSGLPSGPATSVCFDQRSTGNESILYATIYGAGVFHSTNGGRSWSAMNAGLPARPYAWRLRQSPDHSLYLICTLGNPGGLWRLDESTRTWVRLDPGFSSVTDVLVGKNADWAPGFLAVSVGDGSQAGVQVSKDGGASWTRIYEQPARAIECSPDLLTWFVAGNGLWRSDRGGEWIRQDLPFSIVNDVSWSMADVDTLWVGSAGGGIFRGDLSGSNGSGRPREVDRAPVAVRPRRGQARDRPEAAKRLSDEAARRWQQRLVDRVRNRLERGERLEFMSMFAKGGRVSVDAVTDQSLTLTSDAMTLPVAWALISDLDRMHLSVALAQNSEDPVDHALASLYQTLQGDPVTARIHGARSGVWQQELKADLGE